MQKLLLIQESNAVDYSGPSEISLFRIVRKVGGQSTKRQKTSHLALPEVHTFHATEVSVQGICEYVLRQLIRYQGFGYLRRSGECGRLCEQAGQAGASKPARGGAGRPTSPEVFTAEAFR